VLIPQQWNPINQREEARTTNKHLNILQAKLYDCHSVLINEGIPITVEVLSTFLQEVRMNMG
jgi:hypothetical protein